MTTHELKCWPEYFQAVKDGRKPFEIRKADRPYAVGDVLWLREWRPEYKDYHPVGGTYTGDECRVRVTYVLGDNGPWLPTGYVALGVEPAWLPPPLDPLAVAALPPAPPPDTAATVKLIGELETARRVVEAALAYEAAFAERIHQRLIASRAGLSPLTDDLPEFQAACDAEGKARATLLAAARAHRAAYPKEVP